MLHSPTVEMDKDVTMSTEPNKDKSVKKAAPSRFAEAQKKAERLAAGTAGPGGSNKRPMDATAEFFQGAYSELKKTTWPTREVLVKSTSVVLALVFAVAVWVFTIDLICNRILNPIFGTSPN